jgi:predicted TIM-barrel fold metal-dependent hydrolase
MNDRDRWLELTVEQALDPSVAICDPHHHLWEHPGNRYLLEEFEQDLGGGHRVISTVYVECLQNYRETGPANLKPVGETEFVSRLVGSCTEQSTRIAAGIVGFADLGQGASVEEVLVAHVQASERFRGIRHASAWHADDRIHNAYTRPPRDLLMDSCFREGFACLENLKLSFDAWLYHPQIPELASLAAAFPGINIILNHMAGPLGIGPYAHARDDVFREWRCAMAVLAEHQNVYVKLGGRTMTMSGYGWHKGEKPPGSRELAEAMGPYCDAGIELFGVDRCMFESNFPVDRASCSYTVLWNAFKRLSRGYSPSERAAVLHDTATKVYRLEEEPALTGQTSQGNSL